MSVICQNPQTAGTLCLSSLPMKPQLPSSSSPSNLKKTLQKKKKKKGSLRHYKISSGMESCHPAMALHLWPNLHSIPPPFRTNPSCITIYSTLGHLIHVIEELKNKEKLIAQLEQDLGHQSSYMMQLEKKITTQDKGSSPQTSGSTTPGRTTLTAYNYSPSRDLDGNQQTNLKEQPDHQIKGSKSFSHLIRKADKENSTALAQIRSLQQKVSEQYKTIAALRQACSEKDRRIELIQHRKMKRRLRRSMERSANDDDTCSVDSEISVSSLPMDNGSNEEQLDLWDEYAREEVERNYQQLMREHLELKKSYTLLQAQSASSLDPQREAKLCRALESDLFDAQCKIEELKTLLHSTGLEPRLLEEKETLQAANVEMQKKLKRMEVSEERLQAELNEAKELIEDLEFRVLELDECQNQSLEDGNDSFDNEAKPSEGDDKEKETSSGGVSRTLFPESGVKDSNVSNASNSSDMSSEDEQRLREEVNSLRKQIIELTERPPPEFPLRTSSEKEEIKEQEEQQQDVILSDSNTQKLLQKFQLRVEELEKTVVELQSKIITLQQEKLKLEEKLGKYVDKDTKEKQIDTRGGSISQTQSDKYVDELNGVTFLDKNGLEGHDVSDGHISSQNKTEEDKQLGISESNEVDCNPVKNSEQVQSLNDEESQDLYSKSLNKSDEFVESLDSSVLDVCLQGEQDNRGTEVDGEEDTESKDNWKEIESAIICETIAEFQAERDIENMDSSNIKEGSLDLLNYPDNNSLLADDVDDENMELLQQQSECLESIKQILSEQGILSHVELMLKEMEEIKEENAMLRDKLTGNGSSLSSGELINAEFAMERLHQIEEVCENLRNKVHSTEQSEILLKTKLKHAEDTVSELEASESLLKEQLEKISIREAEWKKKAQGLLRSVSELEQLLKEKDAIEDKLNEKIQALEEAELLNARKLAELKEDENDLRESLRSREDYSNDSELSKKLEKMAELEKDNELLKAKISELEESEVLLREHWKQLADAEANKSECLQEKIKMLESLNKELQSKLQDEEEKFATGMSLASELSLIQNLSDSEESQPMSEVESKLKEVENRLYNVTESKNSKIEMLEDRLERLQQNEQKLSETIIEMEQREKQLLAKLKLCEHSDFTIEKMLNYEDHIKELSHSQENLLNAFDTLADPESQSQQIISALKAELLSCRQKSDDLSFKERQINELLNNENNSLKCSLDQHESKEKELDAKILLLEEENKSLRAELENASEPSQNGRQEVTTSSLFVRIQELETENQELRSKIGDSRSMPRAKPGLSVSLNYERLCELEKENSELLAEVNKLRDIESHQKVTSEKIRLLEMNEEKLMEKVIELEDSCESQNEELQKLYKERNDSSNKNLVKKLHVSETQLEEEQKRVAELQKVMAETQEKLSAEEAANSSLQEQLESFRLKLEEVRETYVKHESSKILLEQELTTIRQEKELLSKELQLLNKSHVIPGKAIKEFQSLKTDEHSSGSSDVSLVLPSTENKYLILIDQLESSLESISHESSEEWLANEYGKILSSPKKFLSKSKIDESLADPIFEELLQLSQKELATLIQALQKEMQKKCEKLRDFENEFKKFLKETRDNSIIYRDEEIQKIVCTETRTFQKSSKNQVPPNERTTLAGEKETPTGTCKKELSAEPQQKQQNEPKEETSKETVKSYVQIPCAEYDAWQTKVAILTDIEANLPNVMESASQLELLLDILQERKNILCSDDQVGISNEELLYYAKLFQTVNKSLNGRSAHQGTGAETTNEVLHNSEEQSIAKEEVTVPLSKASRKFDTANASERKKLIVKLISNLPSEDLAVAARALKRNAAKRKLVDGGKFTIGLLGKLRKEEEEEIEVDMWLSSEDDDDEYSGRNNNDNNNEDNDVKNNSKEPNQDSQVQEEAEQTDSDSNALCGTDKPKPEDQQNDDDESKPPLPKSPPPSMPPVLLLEEPSDTFAKTIDRNVSETTASTNHPHQSKSADQSEQQVCELTRVLNDKNKYISTLEASIEKLGYLLAQQHGSTHTEEAIKSFEEQLKNLQQELRQHHKEGQQCLTSLRSELQNKSEVKHTTVVQNFQRTQFPKPASLSHSYSTTDISKIVNASMEFDTPLKVPHPMQTWASRGHIAPPTFSRTLRRRSDTFDPQILPANHQGGGYVPPASLWPGEKATANKCSNRMFVAAADYDPKLFSTSGYPHRELKLKEGDIVKTKGLMGHNGYYEAEVNGKVGLAPAKYLHLLKPETISSEERTFKLQISSESFDSNLEQVIQPEPWSYFSKSNKASFPKIPSGHSIQANLKGWNKSVSMPRLPGTPTSSTTSPAHSAGGQHTKRHSGGPFSHPHTKGLPEAPSNFCLERLVGENSVLLSWQPPLMDELDQNNGMQLIGYRIFLNGQLCQQPGSAHLAKAVVENLDLTRPQYFAIQSVAASGQMSSPAEVVFEGLDRWLDDGQSDLGSDTDLSDILPSPHLSLGPRKMYIAIYDYNPSTQSPHDYPDCELQFRAGDHITVYGNERSDGFFWGEFNGTRGLVPASFLEEVPTQGTRSKPVSRRGSTASQNSLVQGVGRPST